MIRRVPARLLSPRPTLGVASCRVMPTTVMPFRPGRHRNAIFDRIAAFSTAPVQWPQTLLTVGAATVRVPVFNKNPQHRLSVHANVAP